MSTDNKDSLHAAVMNLPCDVPSGYPFGSELCAGVYRQGHRDARHAAAELVARSIAAGAAAATEPLYANSMGYALAMRVMQSDLYPSLDPEERAECDEFIRRGQSRSSLLVEEGQAQHQAGSAHLAAPSGHVPTAAPLSSPLQADRSELPRRLWLWKNHVDGRPEFWAFEHLYPVHMDNGDPQTLGEPCGYALLKPSRPGRTVCPKDEERAIARAWRSESHQQLMKFYAVDSLEALVDKQAYHIEKLQAKLPPTPSLAPQRVREG